jgi:DeoR family fructose operon transcriptional repressor
MPEKTDGGREGVAVFAEERRAAIMSMLDRDASVQVADIAETFGVSRVTVRGDLDALERAGRLRRTHGGAVSLSRTLTVSIQDKRVNVNVAAKQAIARAALDLVHDGDSILVDSGTTALELVRTLGGREGVTVVTGDFTIADFVDRSLPRTDVVMLGGALRKGHRYTYGPLALRSLEALHPTNAFLCPTSYVPGRGLMTNYAAMAELKVAFLTCATHAYVLMDASKVGAPGLLRVGDLTGIEAVVMDRDPDGVVAADLEGTATRLVIAGE